MPAWGRTDMIRPCRCNGVPDLTRVPSPSCSGWALNRQSSAGTVFGFNSRCARCSSRHGPWFEVCSRDGHCSFQWNVAAVEQNPRQYHNTVYKYLESRWNHTHRQTQNNHSTTRYPSIVERNGHNSLSSWSFQSPTITNLWSLEEILSFKVRGVTVCSTA